MYSSPQHSSQQTQAAAAAAAAAAAMRQRQASSDGGGPAKRGELRALVHEFEFTNLEFVKPTRMNKVRTAPAGRCMPSLYACGVQACWQGAARHRVHLL